jgi:hypothetical protein
MDIRDRARLRARRAFERAQWRAAFVTAAPLAVIAPLAALLHEGATPSATGLIAIALGAALLVAGWRGDGWRRGATVGLVAGLPGLLLPRVVLAPIGHCAMCAPLDVSGMTCFLACGGAGLFAGVVVGALAARDPAPVRFAITAGAIACLTAALTCIVAGMAGVTGIAAGIAASTAPAAILRARAHIA